MLSDRSDSPSCALPIYSLTLELEKEGREVKRKGGPKKAWLWALLPEEVLKAAGGDSDGLESPEWKDPSLTCPTWSPGHLLLGPLCLKA